MVISLLALAMAAIAGIANQPQHPDVNQMAAVRIVTAEHRIEFPERIVMSLEAEAAVNVDEIQLFYRIAGQNASVYGYPKTARTSGILTAEFDITTNGTTFIPSGVEIEYYYLFKSSDGSQFETERYYVEYLDPQYDWRRLDAGPVEILWHDRPLSSVEDAAEKVADRVERITEVLGSQPSKKMKAVIVNNRSEAGRTFPVVSQAASDSNLYGGFAYGNFDVFILSGLGVDGMIHELTHLFVDEVIGSPLAKMPSWLGEGLAMYFENGAAGRNSTVSNAASNGSLLPLHGMGAVPGRPSEVRQFYAQAWSVVDFMIEDFGDERMSHLLRSIDEGDTIGEATFGAYGLTIDQLDAAWRSQINPRPSFTTIVDPGTFGTSVIIAGAMVVAATAVTVKWLRRDRTVTSIDE
ncbi:MAG TPA: peptidase MA family metallohydrolase [SAR202 cluster bacterium]|nr:peptidase MA family metallohydrolase [SAR202 cluster bacterium]HJO82733.1 peptidase MA family metallohydrolase [SAR202 cluster bacterium]